MTAPIVCVHGIVGKFNCLDCLRAGRRAYSNRRNAVLKARGLTQKGLPYQRGPEGRPAALRVLSRIDHVGDCWVYQGAKDHSGYGRIGVNGKGRLAHVVIYEAIVGSVPEGLQLDHVYERGCRHKACVNPAHLEPVTPAENIRRMYAVEPSGKRSQATKGWWASMTPEQRSENRRRAWATRKAKQAM